MDIDNIGIAVILKNTLTNKYLAIEEPNTSKGSNKNSGDLSFVVGHVKKDEDLLDSVKREALEESGVESIDIKHLISIFHITKGDVVFIFYGETDQEQLEEGEWLEFEEFRNKENLRPHVDQVLDLYKTGTKYPLDIITSI